MKKNDPLIVLSETYAATKVEVWKALTDLEEMKLWYFDNIPSFEAEVGFETSFPVQAPSRLFIHQWKILEVEPLSKINYAWTFEGILGKSNSIFTLHEMDQNATELTVTCETIEDFPDDIPEFKSESCRAGWKYFLKDRLKNYLNKKIQIS